MESSTDTLAIDFTNSELETIQEVSESSTPEGNGSLSPESQSRSGSSDSISSSQVPEPVSDVSNPVPDVSDPVPDVSNPVPDVSEPVPDVTEQVVTEQVPYDNTLVPRLYT